MQAFTFFRIGNFFCSGIMPSVTFSKRVENYAVSRGSDYVKLFVLYQVNCLMEGCLFALGWQQG